MSNTTVNSDPTAAAERIRALLALTLADELEAA